MSARVARVRGYLELAKCRAPFEAVCRNETREGQWPAIATKCSCFRALCGLLRCAERRARNRADSPPIEEEEGRGCTPTLPAIGAIGLRAPTVAGTRGVALELVAIAGDSRGSGGSMRVSTARVVELAVANAGLGELDGPGCAPRIQAKQAIAVRCGVDLGTGADTIVR